MKSDNGGQCGVPSQRRGPANRLTQIVADVRLEPGEWLSREGAPASFYVLVEGRLRIVLDVHGKQTEFAEQEFKQSDFVGEVPL